MAKYSARIYFLAERGMNEIGKVTELMADTLPDEHSEATWFLVFQEFVNVYLHITEREAFSQVGNSGHPEIMNPLVLFSIDCSVELRLAEQLPPEKRQAIKKDWVQRLNTTNQLYGRCKKTNCRI
jgi:hypothetical protein